MSEPDRPDDLPRTSLRDLAETWNRLDWWLREHGHPPSVDEILALRTPTS